MGIRTKLASMVYTKQSRLGLLSFTLLLWLLVTVAAASAEDLRIDRKRSHQIIGGDGAVLSSHEGAEVIFIGATAARFDAGYESFIVRRDDEVFLWLDHETRSYAELRLPLIFENLLTTQEKECMRGFPVELAGIQASVVLTAERRVIESFDSRELRIEGRSPSGLRYEEHAWITHDLPVDLGPYHLLVRNRAALTTRTRGWIAQVLDKGGYSVESTKTVRVRGHSTIVDEQRLEAVRHVKADATRYLPPAGYLRNHERPPIDFHCGPPA